MNHDIHITYDPSPVGTGSTWLIVAGIACTIVAIAIVAIAWLALRRSASRDP